jgi:hypothetical protein
VDYSSHGVFSLLSLPQFFPLYPTSLRRPKLRRPKLCRPKTKNLVIEYLTTVCWLSTFFLSTHHPCFISSTHPSQLRSIPIGHYHFLQVTNTPTSTQCLSFSKNSWLSSASSPLHSRPPSSAMPPQVLTSHTATPVPPVPTSGTRCPLSGKSARPQSSSPPSTSVLPPQPSKARNSCTRNRLCSKFSTTPMH